MLINNLKKLIKSNRKKLRITKKKIIKTYNKLYSTIASRVIIISYPKSGRTFLRVLVGYYICNNNKLSNYDIMDLYKLTKQAGLPTTLLTHDGSNYRKGKENEQIQTDKSHYAKKKIILLVRDPRDILVSYYFESTRRKNYFHGTISEFIRSYQFGIESILRFYKSWELNQHVPKDFLLIRYEKMVSNPGDILRTVLNFISCQDIDENIIKDSLRFANFENMKQLEQIDFFNNSKFRPKNLNDPESYKVRRGVIGGYVDYIEKQDITYLNNILAKNGCPFYPNLLKKCGIESSN